MTLAEFAVVISKQTTTYVPVSLSSELAKYWVVAMLLEKVFLSVHQPHLSAGNIRRHSCPPICAAHANTTYRSENSKSNL
jgi:hypothetical protein